jgi:hypothetical protein
LQPPYILFTISNSGRIDESRIQQMESLDLSLTADDDGQSMLPAGEGKIGRGHYEPENHLIWRRVSLPAGPYGGVKVLSGMLLTQVGFVRIMGYSPLADYRENEKIFRQITTSIELDEWLRYQPNETRNFFMRQSGSFWITIVALLLAAWLTNWLGKGSE